MPHRSRVVIDRVRKDGLVFASDYTDCDHGMDGFRKVMFRLPAGAPRLPLRAPPSSGGAPSS
jgi:hypothetical protein